MFYFSIQLGMLSSQVTLTPSFFRGVLLKITNQCNMGMSENSVYPKYGYLPTGKWFPWEMAIEAMAKSPGSAV